MLVAGRLQDRIGVAAVMTVSAVALAASMVIMAALPSVTVLLVAVLLMISASGAFDVAINGAAMADATWSRPARMTLLHAGFSGGGAFGALAAGALSSTPGLPFTLGYVAIAVLMAGLAVAALVTRWPATEAPKAATPLVAATLLPLAVVAALAFLAEGSMETWAALYLRTSLGASPFVGALGPAAFHAAMLAGRLAGTGLVGRLGTRAALLVAGITIAAAMTGALLSPVAWLTIVGLGIAALGASFVAPVVISLAARRSGGRAGRAASYVLTLGYAGFLVGPPLIGLSSEIIGLRLALVIIPITGLAIAIGSRRLSR